MEIVGGLLGFAVLVLLLMGLLHAVNALMAHFAWASVLLIGVWVAGNIFGMLHVEELGKNSPFYAALSRVWSAIFFYTALLQTVVFTVAVFWGGALLFRDDIEGPATATEFAIDFARGSSVIAAVMFVGTGGYAAMELGGLGRAVAIVYLVPALASGFVAWLPQVQLEQRAATQPTLVFWVTVGAYAVLSVAGMALYGAADRPMVAGTPP